MNNQQSEPEPISALSTGLTVEQVAVNTESLPVSLNPQIMPSDPITNPFGAPSHIRLDLERVDNGQTVYFEPHISIYPIEEYRAAFENEEGNDVTAKLDQLNALLSDSPPAISGELPVLPFQYAAQVMAIKLKPLRFQNGSGIRFISYYVQMGYPPLNGTILYTYQGITDDGQHYISAWYPISAAGLPNTFEESGLPDDRDEFDQVFPAYMQETIRMLSELDADSYTPSLNQLDAMMQSLQVSGN